jgi:hypothetical protein
MYELAGDDTNKFCNYADPNNTDRIHEVPLFEILLQLHVPDIQRNDDSEKTTSKRPYMIIFGINNVQLWSNNISQSSSQMTPFSRVAEVQ